MEKRPREMQEPSDAYSFPEEFGDNGFGPADSGYGAPGSSADSGYGAPGVSLDTGYGSPGAGDSYGAPAYSRTGRRRRPRQLVPEPSEE